MRISDWSSDLCSSDLANDAVEAHAVAMLFPDTLHAGSTKGWTGHTLGAAGIVESVFVLIALEDGLLPGTLNSEARDAACGAQIHFDNARSGRLRYAMHNSFGFGRTNPPPVVRTACPAPAPR